MRQKSYHIFVISWTNSGKKPKMTSETFVLTDIRYTVLSFLFGELVGGNETLVALGTYEFGIPPAHPAKAKPKNRDNRHEAAKLVQTLEFLFEPSNPALLQPLIAKQKFPDSFFYHLRRPKKHPTGTCHREDRVLESKHET